MTRAFTISTEDSLPMAEECQRRVGRYCGTTLEIFMAKNRDDAFRKKLTSRLDFDGPVWFVDADMWFIRSSVLPPVTGSIIVGAPCDTPDPIIERPPWFDLKMLLCSSLIGMDMGDKVSRKVAEKAALLQHEKYGDGKINYDGLFINVAAQMEPKMMICRLGNDWNWCSDIGLEKARNVHAASMRSGKYEWLKTAVKNLP